MASMPGNKLLLRKDDTKGTWEGTRRRDRHCQRATGRLWVGDYLFNTKLSKVCWLSRLADGLFVDWTIFLASDCC